MSKYEKMQIRESYNNVWHTDLTHSITTDFPYCCFALWCSPCASYMLRKRALHNDMSRYTCCAGICRAVVLVEKVWCCFANSVQSTRFLLQDEFNIQNTKCDNCIIGFMFCIQQVACIFSCIAAILGSEELSEIANLLTCLADGVYCTVCACMQTQHKVEMDKWDGKFGPVERPMQPPQFQMMSRIDQPVPPPVGYAPGYPPPQAYPPPQGYGQPAYGQPAYGQPYPAGYPPPQGGYAR